MLNARLYILQRLTALIMAPLVLGHLGMIIYAIDNGLSAAEILSRTQGSIFWALFYGIFVTAVAIHAAIGIRVVTFEISGLRGHGLSTLTWVTFMGFLLLGARAVHAVTMA